MKVPIKSDRDPGNKISRRRFLGGTAAAAAAFTIVPRHVLGGIGFTSPSDKLNIGCVGVWGKGRSDIISVSTENIVALCDVDDEQMGKFEESVSEEESGRELFAKAKKYRDFRKMLEIENLDALTISIPDHSHAAVAMMAIKMGKHAFVQKPLTHTIYEARKLAEAAREAKVVTQMGNQGHAGEGGRLINEWIWDGAIGAVREVHAWTNRPIWPQGIKRPSMVVSRPPTLDWEVWLGPAPYRPYHYAYAPFNWRGWRDFGTGAIGDMGAHILDHPFWALKLGHPTSVEATCSEFNDETYPLTSKIQYHFPARDEMPPVELTWFDGENVPPRPPELEEGRRMGDRGGGVVFIGDKGMLMCSTYGMNPRIIPETKMREYERPAKTIPRSPGIHEEWVAACKGGPATTSSFDYAGTLTEVMLLGIIAMRMAHLNTPLEWDGENMKITNIPEANEYIHKLYRYGWRL
ncbi:MAG: Gfo/Idh/MocA family oxidoreductase [bacterium]